MNLVPVAAAGPDPWAFGWEAVAALGGAFAALGTLGALVFLWRNTRDAGAAAEAAQRSADAALEEAAGAWRPVLAVEEGTLIHNFGLAQSDGEVQLQISLRNIGRGPALRIRASLEPHVMPGDSRLSNANRETQSLDHDWFGLLPVDQVAALKSRSHTGPPARSYVMRAFYLDLGGREYQTYAVADAEPVSSNAEWRQLKLVPKVVMVPRSGDEDAALLAQLDARERNSEIS